MMIRLLALILLFCLAAPIRADLARLLSTGAKPKKLADGFGFTEGPAWDGKGNLYFTDLKNKTMHRWSEADGLKLLRKHDETFVNGLSFDSRGRLFACEAGKQRLIRIDGPGAEVVVADRVGGRLIGHPNDVWVAPNNGIYFSVPNKRKIKKLAQAGVLMGTMIYVPPNRTKARDVGKAVGMKGPNGVVGSADGRRLYYTGGGKCWVSDIQRDGSLKNKRLAATKGSDGLTLDELGNLYTTGKEGVTILASGAKEIGTIPFPETPANLTFGGTDGRTLFVTARTALYSIRMNVRGDAFARSGLRKLGSAAKPSASKAPSSRRAPNGLLAFLERNCFDCHDSDVSKGDLDLTALGFELTDSKNYSRWAQIFQKVEKGEMPPHNKPQPKADERREWLEDLATQLTATDRDKRQRLGRSELRRLSRVEYANSLKDILNLPHHELADMLPPDGLAHGYKKSAKALDFSHVMMTRYLEVADYALREALAPRAHAMSRKTVRAELRSVDGVTDTLQTLRVQLKQTTAIPLVGRRIDPTLDVSRGNFQKRDPGYVKDPPPHFDGVVTFMNNRGNHNIVMKPFKVHQSGYYKLRVNGWGVLNDHGKLLPSARVETIAFYTPTGRLLGRCDLPPNEPATGETTVWLKEGEPIHYLAISTDNNRLGGKAEPRYAQLKGYGAALRWFEMEGPLDKEWPPESHRRLLGNLPLEATAEQDNGLRYRVVTQDAQADAARLLRRFAARAYRRPLRADDLEIPMDQIRARLKRGEPFVDAMLAGYRAVLTAPEFLLLEEKPGRLDAWALASRLSFFLCNSPPDEELRKAAASGEVLADDVLRQQTERLLDHPQSARFVEHFLDYWIDLRDIRLTEPDSNLYPEYDSLLGESMVEETRAFFAELIREDLGAFNIIESDFVTINQRMAQLYGIPGVLGSHTRKVALAADSTRGGMLTQGSLLKITANGTTTSPVVRGTFALTRLLGDPPPPPPAAVPAIEPDISGVTTIREQLAKHRADPSCAGCHQKIDPPGFALESFDVMGAFRDRYRATRKKGEPGGQKRVAGVPVRYRMSLPVETHGKLPDGRAFKSIKDFRERLRDSQAQIARNLFGQFIIYATGSPVGFADRAQVDEMLARLARKDYGVRSMIHELVQSDLFRKK